MRIPPFKEHNAPDNLGYWTNKKTGELLVLRGYAWFKWDGLKVVESYNAFDPTEYNKVFTE